MSDRQTASFHYVITLQWVHRSGAFAFNTQSGVVDIPLGMTRHQVLREYLMPRSRREAGAPEEGPITVLFFSLEPNQLTAETQDLQGVRP